MRRPPAAAAEKRCRLMRTLFRAPKITGLIHTQHGNAAKPTNLHVHCHHITTSPTNAICRPKRLRTALHELLDTPRPVRRANASGGTEAWTNRGLAPNLQLGWDKLASADPPWCVVRSAKTASPYQPHPNPKKSLTRQQDAILRMAQPPPPNDASQPLSTPLNAHSASPKLSLLAHRTPRSSAH